MSLGVRTFIIYAARGSIFGAKPGSSPDRRSQIWYELFDSRLDSWNDLDGRRSSSNNGNGLPLEVEIVVPAGAVHQFSPKSFDPWNVWILPGAAEDQD